jgi:hypothetical protein
MGMTILKGLTTSIRLLAVACTMEPKVLVRKAFADRL